LLLVIGLAACRQVVGIVDTTGQDGPVADAGEPIDAADMIDASPGSPDAPPGAPDARPDARPPDARPPDAMPPPPDAMVTPPDAMPSCPASYTLVIGGKSYRPVATSATWTNARNDCADDAPGLTHLAVPNNATENTGLANAQTQDSWIGITDAATEGTWLDVFGMPLTYTAWAGGQPDGGNCALINNAAAWVDESCNNSIRYICECE
jgi:hypothetical protein